MENKLDALRGIIKLGMWRVMYIDDPMATNVIGKFGMAFGITVVVAMFVGKIGEKTNDLTPNHKSL